eukprot:scaffold180_cov311-Pinguiococcus_pyrenoidosus.AAC.10
MKGSGPFFRPLSMTRPAEGRTAEEWRPQAPKKERRRAAQPREAQIPADQLTDVSSLVLQYRYR